MRLKILICAVAAALAACLDTTVSPPPGETAHELTRDEMLTGYGGWWYVSAVGGDRGTRWREPGYRHHDEPNWIGRSGPWGYGETWITETIPYGPSASSKPPTVYAIESFRVEDTARVRGLRLETLYDDGIVVYLNGTEVARRAMPAGPVTYWTLAAGHEATAGAYETIDLTSHIGLLADGDNTIQVEVHQQSQSSSDLAFAGALFAQIQDPPPPPAEGFIARRSEWSYWDGGGDLGTAWRLPGYDVSQWRRGGGPLGYGETWLGTTVSYGGNAGAKPITTYFRRDLHVADPSAIKHLLGRLMYDDGVVIYLNGTELQRNSMPAGAVTATTPALGHEATAGTYTPYDWDGAIPLLVAGTNTIAVEVHQQTASSSDLVFDLELLLYLASGSDPFPTTRTAAVARRSTWSYWDRGGDLGTAWRAPAYADGGWATGAGPLGYGESYLATTVGYGPSAASKHPTTYFRTHLDVDLAGGATVTGLGAELMYDDGAVVYVNGQEVARLAMPAGPITAATRSTGHEANNAYTAVELDAFRHLIVDGDNVIAVELHQLDAGSSDLVFDLSFLVEIDGGGVTTPVFTPYAANPIIAPSGDIEGPTRWRADTVGAPEVERVNGAWVMYFFANDGLGPHHATGRAISTDGVDWTVDEDPAGGGGDVESMVHDGTRYYLYTADFWEEGIWVATSTDGRTWEHDHDQVIGTGDTAAVTFDGAWFEMWSTAVGHVVYSTSPDGVTWTTHGIVLGLLPDGGFDVVKDAAGYHGWDVTDEGMWYLTSADGLRWRRHGLSLPLPSPGAWDERGDLNPSVVRDGATWRMFYEGIGGDFAGRIGTATAPAP